MKHRVSDAGLGSSGSGGGEGRRKSFTSPPFPPYLPRFLPRAARRGRRGRGRPLTPPSLPRPSFRPPARARIVPARSDVCMARYLLGKAGEQVAAAAMGQSGGRGTSAWQWRVGGGTAPIYITLSAIAKSGKKGTEMLADGRGCAKVPAALTHTKPIAPGLRAIAFLRRLIMCGASYDLSDFYE